jgi:hypothetical protein
MSVMVLAPGARELLHTRQQNQIIAGFYGSSMLPDVVNSISV